MEGKVIGILGGMGPAATLELFSRIIDNTVAEVDQDHINTIIINDPQIPDRSNYILEDGPSPIPKLIENLKKLSQAGAQVAVIPCMTAHSFLKELKYNSPIPILNAMDIIDKHIQMTYPHIQKIGLLATNGSVESKVFSEYISREIIVPQKVSQIEVMDVIYGEDGIKSGNASDQVTKRLKHVTEQLIQENNIEAVIAGCTELSLVIDDESMGVPVIDPVTLLAKETIAIGKGCQHINN